MSINRQQMTRDMRKEIIVYLDYHSKVADGGGDLILDFRREEDYARFVNVFEEQNGNGGSSGTYLRITGYSTDKRLMRGGYYSLNVELLNKARLRRITDSYLFLAEFDFSELDSQEFAGQELLQSHEPLDPGQMYWRNQHKPNGITMPNVLPNLQLYVAGVGQANWNELRSNGNTIIQYDMGAELNTNRQQVRGIFQAHSQHIYSNNKAILVISHWDMDHVHCLLAMNDNDIRNTFRKVICPNVIKSNTARRILKHLTSVLTSANVHCFSPHYHNPHTDYHVHPLLQLNGNIALYIGENRRNLNHSGIVMFVNGGISSVNYTGDSLLRQAEEAMLDAVSRGSQTNSHILIAPHHGGTNEKKYMQYITPSSTRQTIVCISVGSGNQYGHPDSKMLNYLNLISGGNIMRTDWHGDITINI